MIENRQSVESALEKVNILASTGEVVSLQTQVITKSGEVIRISGCNHTESTNQSVAAMMALLLNKSPEEVSSLIEEVNKHADK